MAFFIRTLALICGVICWIYLSVPRFDVERRSSSRYRKALGICKNIWIVSTCTMLVLIKAFPTNAVSVVLVLSLLTTFLCYMILDEIE
jgi:hypothetical protein